MSTPLQGRFQNLRRSARLPVPRCRPAGASALTFLALAWMVTGCGPDGESGEVAIDRDTFVEVQADFQMAAMETETGEIPSIQRDSILRERGLDEGVLQSFLAVHGEDEDYMDEVWAEVDEQVREAMGLGPGDVEESEREEEPADPAG